MDGALSDAYERLISAAGAGMLIKACFARLPALAVVALLRGDGICVIGFFALLSRVDQASSELIAVKAL